jgi:hypothetical protein
MSTPDTSDDGGDIQPATEPDRIDDSVVTPPSYPAYSTPPPEGLPDAEHG